MPIHYNKVRCTIYVKPEELLKGTRNGSHSAVIDSDELVIMEGPLGELVSVWVNTETLDALPYLLGHTTEAPKRREEDDNGKADEVRESHNSD